MYRSLQCAAALAVCCLLLFVELSVARLRENSAERAQHWRQHRAAQAAPKPQLEDRAPDTSKYRFYNAQTARMPISREYVLPFLTATSFLR